VNVPSCARKEKKKTLVRRTALRPQQGETPDEGAVGSGRKKKEGPRACCLSGEKKKESLTVVSGHGSAEKKREKKGGGLDWSPEKKRKEKNRSGRG